MSLKILVVDDDEGMRLTLSGVLEEEGHQVEVAENGYQALALVKAKAYRIVFMDVKMPGLSGVETYLELKKIRPEATVIMMTGFSIEEMVERALREGAYAVLHKPFDMDLVKSMLGSMEGPAVLVTDDEYSFRETLRENLIEKGLRVEAAADGREALAKLAERDIDVVLMDVRMPVMDGMAAFEWIRQHRPGVPVVMMSGFSHEEALERAIHNGAFATLAKPFEIGKVVEIINRARAMLAAKGEGK